MQLEHVSVDCPFRLEFFPLCMNTILELEVNKTEHTQYSLQCILYSVECTVYIVHYTGGYSHYD